MRRWIALTLAALGCAQGEPLGTAQLDTREPASTAAEPRELTCGMDLRVAAEWLPMAQRQGDRWAAATGCPVTFSEAGTPVAVVDQLFLPEGGPAWGLTVVVTEAGRFTRCTSVSVSTASADLEQTLRHELGHCLGAVGGIDGRGHTDAGIMKAWHLHTDASHINAEALELICGNVPCAVFNPEDE